MDDMKDVLSYAQKEVAIYERAIKRFGRTAQIIKAIEELSELTQALAKWVNTGSCQREGGFRALEAQVNEERADVAIMLNQLEIIFGDSSDIEWKKIQRLEGILDSLDEMGEVNHDD